MTQRCPLVSVIVPIYNVENFLVECIESIVNQSYGNFEILLIDDGSTDNSGKIARDYSQRFENIIYIQKNNGGLSDARNVGIDNSHGEYITFVDSDDILEEDFIKELVELIQREGTLVAQIGYTRVTEDNQPYITDASIPSKNVENVKSLSKEDFIEGLLSGKIPSAAWCNIYSKDFFQKIRFKVNRVNEDLLLWIDGIDLIDYVPIFNRKLYRYRSRVGSITDPTKSVKVFSDSVLNGQEWINKIYKDFSHVPKLIEVAHYNYFYNMLLYIKFCNDKNPIHVINYRNELRENIFSILSNPYFSIPQKIAFAIIINSVSLYRKILKFFKENKTK
ncbi:glycosyltransferase [Aerococcaceae bacterium zg-ZUI334]|uniref:glycosyltransferase family 2 protein n=1 Tax=Aerococcaceae bacterium zg-252 TaxID=2796928 RepID=UPI001B9E7243|nr:glycosyltransferase [Aerococcaceae bacterium zg-ZUI334]